VGNKAFVHAFRYGRSIINVPAMHRMPCGALAGQETASGQTEAAT